MWKWSDLKRLLRKRDKGFDVKNLAAVMWPAVYPSDMLPPDEPHVTIIFLGEIDTFEGFTKQDVIDVIKTVPHDFFLWADVDGLDWFGPEQNIPVLRVRHDYLSVVHQSLKASLDARGIPYDTRFPEYKPHVSITDEAALSGVWPDKILLTPVELWWGGEHIKIHGDDHLTRQVAL